MIVSLADTVRFYDLLDRLEAHVGGTHVLDQCNGRMTRPRRDIDFSSRPASVELVRYRVPAYRYWDTRGESRLMLHLKGLEPVGPSLGVLFGWLTMGRL